MIVNTANRKAFLQAGLMSLLYAVRRQFTAFRDSGRTDFQSSFTQKCSVHSGAGTNSTVTTRLLAARIGAAIDRARGYVLRPIAKRLCTERTYMTPCDSAGVAINNSPMEFVAICLKVGPAWTTEISPSSLDR